MYKNCFILLLLVSFMSNSQDNWNQNQRDVKQTILDFFEAFHQGDTTTLKNTMAPQLTMHTIAKTKENNVEAVKVDIKTFLTAISNRSEDLVWEERLLDFKIDANAEIAQVWTPYEFYVNKKFSHCGVNIFQLFHDGEKWMIIAIADTRKKEGCL